jgi:hypothetical protein
MVTICSALLLILDVELAVLDLELRLALELALELELTLALELVLELELTFALELALESELDKLLSNFELLLAILLLNVSRLDLELLPPLVASVRIVKICGEPDSFPAKSKAVIE